MNGHVPARDQAHETALAAARDTAMSLGWEITETRDGPLAAVPRGTVMITATAPEDLTARLRLRPPGDSAPARRDYRGSPRRAGRPCTSGTSRARHRAGPRYARRIPDSPAV